MPRARQGNAQAHPEREESTASGLSKTISQQGQELYTIAFSSDGPSGRNNTSAAPRKGRMLIRGPPTSPWLPPHSPLLCCSTLVLTPQPLSTAPASRAWRRGDSCSLGTRGLYPVGGGGWAGGPPVAQANCMPSSLAAVQLTLKLPHAPLSLLPPSHNQAMSWPFRAVAPQSGKKVPPPHSHPR